MKLCGKAKEIVYRSKDQEDFEKAKGLLAEAGISFDPVEYEEVPACGCGGKVDPRKFMNGGKTVPTRIYRIEVERQDKAAAEAALDGNVQPVRAYGYGI